jgi:Leucine-rich repeat (LRR) protein
MALQRLSLSGCEQLQDLRPVAELTELRRLDLTACEQLQELQPLAGLRALESLNLSGCEQLQDLQSLTGLARLKQLNIYEGSQLDCSPGAQPLASWISLTGIYANRLIAAPSKLGSRNLVDNALPRIRGWQEHIALNDPPSVAG